MEEVDQRVIGDVRALIGESDKHTSPVGGIGMALDESAASQSVNTVGHGAGSHQRLLE